MTKTVKQIVDEYKNRNQRNNIFFVMFINNGRRDGYSKVTNLHRDGIKLESPELDTCEHLYEFDSGVQPTTLKPDIKWTHRTFRGQIIEFSQEIME